MMGSRIAFIASLASEIALILANTSQTYIRTDERVYPKKRVTSNTNGCAIRRSKLTYSHWSRTTVEEFRATFDVCTV
jgi:hypothetical protein